MYFMRVQYSSGRYFHLHFTFQHPLRDVESEYIFLKKVSAHQLVFLFGGSVQCLTLSPGDCPGYCCALKHLTIFVFKGFPLNQ